MREPRRIDRLAKLSLLLALGLALLGLYLRESLGAAYWGGLLMAFGEAALVGGLADWFAVRALFVHPLGLPFPHSALIPRNRERITREIRELVLKEWLPLSLLRSKIEAFDFVGSGLQPLVEPLRPRLRELLRHLGRDLLGRFSPEEIGPALADSVSGAVDAEKVRSFLAQFVRQARERGWLDPLLREWVEHFRAWATSPTCRLLLRERVQQATDRYRDRHLMRMMMFNLAEAFGGLDLDEATDLIQSEIVRFIGDQMNGDSQLRRVARDGLAQVEERLQHDPDYLDDLRTYLAQSAESGPLVGLVESLLIGLQQEGLRELDRDDSRLLSLAQSYLDIWLSRVSDDEKTRAQFNNWCRRWAVSFLERNHSFLGALVEEQMNRFTDHALTELIESRVGEDLNWIRLNGTFVGGLIGIVLYLLFTGISHR